MTPKKLFIENSHDEKRTQVMLSINHIHFEMFSKTILKLQYFSSRKIINAYSYWKNLFENAPIETFLRFEKYVYELINAI